MYLKCPNIYGIHMHVYPYMRQYIEHYNAFNVYRRELAPDTISLTGDRAQGDDSKHWAYSKVFTCYNSLHVSG